MRTHSNNKRTEKLGFELDEDGDGDGVEGIQPVVDCLSDETLHRRLSKRDQIPVCSAIQGTDTRIQQLGP